VSGRKARCGGRKRAHPPVPLLSIPASIPHTLRAGQQASPACRPCCPHPTPNYPHPPTLSDGTAKIADVGLAKIIAKEYSAVTGAVGTLAWVSAAAAAEPIAHLPCAPQGGAGRWRCMREGAASCPGSCAALQTSVLRYKWWPALPCPPPPTQQLCLPPPFHACRLPPL
jgi:hypothetical protein